MTALTGVETRPAVVRRPTVLLWALTLAVLLALWFAGARMEWLAHYPDEWVLPLRDWVSEAMEWLVKEATFGLFTFKEFTRGIAWLLNVPLQACLVLLAHGLEVPLGEESSILIPPLSWLGVLGGVTWLAWRVGSRGLAILVGTCFAYLAVFGQWNSAMVTLSSILVAVPVGIVCGGLLGILGYRSHAFERAITPVLDLMQTVPVFAYLVPVLFLFGFGPVSAMIATIIYAMPPMVRMTMLALRGVSAEVLEFGRMAGCSERQMLWKVLLPSARHSLMVGVNQVIMLSLNMVIIASMIGAGGLGHDVLTSLRRLAIGDGLEAGVAITVLAISLDRLSQAVANRGATPVHLQTEQGFADRHTTLLGIAGILLGTYVLAFFIPALRSYPDQLVIDTGPLFENLVAWVNVHLYIYLDAVKSWLLINLLIPFKRLLIDAPWPGVAVVLAMAGWRIGGWRLGALVASLAIFIAVTGNWEKAMVSAYLCGISVVLAMAIGLPIGILAAGSERFHRIAQNIADTLQTLPSFVYLIPVVMLFQVGDFSAMVAITAYAVAPAIRYTDHGLRGVPGEVIEAAKMSGCRRGQLLWKVKVPLAMPEIMLGVNQTIMMALSMLVITALVGTRDLGQEVYIALTRADTGLGLVAGVCVAFLAIIADRLIGAWAARRKRELGLD
ncbi:ABC transporter permease [Ferruginivarius sediminum]|uniref:ABC transporter permease subunit n=1 Tax=Ferruginivarius sediminum TaxID=2661937 RepID=A0A369T9U6_9PROT|nr:ABC transporter permease subunit [Ferruginivarius sediminum]RDD60947.1 ABC transporter permease subunit [Ferruginivarius sediminum]